ncbi:MAG TPA: sigma factor-like helix-turn-helix DNA-binding protein [Ktedonobacterales bacterium]|nr:sigma factor-like helix-turn-helix DNA-binding protein [Ktedonobacterales bacterium]
MPALPNGSDGDATPPQTPTLPTAVGAPDASALIAQARARLTHELESLPPWGSPALNTRLHAATVEEGISHGALVHFIRQALRQGEEALAHDLFVALLRRLEGVNHRWTQRIVGTMAPASPSTRGSARGAVRDAHEELCQELALHLWEHIAREHHETHEAWELFFQRALTFEQQHIGASFLRRAGRGPVARLASPPAPGSGERAFQHVPIQTLTTLGDLIDQHDGFAAAELADLRDHVARLPDRERQATLLRFWCGASEGEIAFALGNVTTRTVRNLLTRAYVRLRNAYAKSG